MSRLDRILTRGAWLFVWLAAAYFGAHAALRWL